MIAITFALPAESSGFLSMIQERKRVARSGATTISGRFEETELEIVHTGVGRAIAQRHMNDYLETAKPAILISAGFAGAARSNYRVGDLIVAENFSESGLVTSARRILGEQNVHVARLFTSPVMIDSAADRAEIAGRHDAVAIDMETETVARICASRAVPMLSLRVLSDTPHHPFPLPPKVLFNLERQRTDALRLAAHLVAHPAALPRLIRFVGQIGVARRSLTEALVSLLRAGL